MSTNLTVNLDVTLNAKYKRTDSVLNPNGIVDTLNYISLKDSLANGNGTDKANLLYHNRLSIDNDVQFIELDGLLQDSFNSVINFDAIKCIVIKNLQTQSERFLEVGFKNEHYYIGPNGFRLIWEPFARGIEAIVSSASAEEGQIIVSADTAIVYDIILIGSSQENSSSSSGD